MDVPGDYIAQLTVNDGAADSTDTVVVSTQNSAPVADAGADQTAVVGDMVTLNGSGSHDADGDPLTFEWSFLSRPAGSAAALSDPAAVAPTFDVDRFGTCVVQLIVNDGDAGSAADTVTITTENSAPTADAGDDQSVLVGAIVTLDGSGSSDVDGNSLTPPLSRAGCRPEARVPRKRRHAREHAQLSWLLLPRTILIVVRCG